MRIEGGYYTSTGRIPGSYVYVFLCEHASSVIVKIGVSDSPMSRLDDIRQGCPFKGEVFAMVNVPTRKTAFAIEAELLKKFERWRTRGEWLCFTIDDKAIFNATLRTVLARYRKPGWPLKITKVQTPAMSEDLPRQKRRRLGKYMTPERLFSELNERMGAKPYKPGT